MKKRDKVLQAVKAKLTAAFGDKIKDIVLFGSRAWGRPREWSDWDFVVVVRGENTWRLVQQVRSRMYEIDLEHDVFTQTHVVSEDELKHTFRGYEPIFVKALTQGIYA